MNERRELLRQLRKNAERLPLERLLDREETLAAVRALYARRDD